jgi:hypothetical protein
MKAPAIGTRRLFISVIVKGFIAEIFPFSKLLLLAEITSLNLWLKASSEAE